MKKQAVKKEKEHYSARPTARELSQNWKQSNSICSLEMRYLYYCLPNLAVVDSSDHKEMQWSTEARPHEAVLARRLEEESTAREWTYELTKQSSPIDRLPTSRTRGCMDCKCIRQSIQEALAQAAIATSHRIN